MTPSRRVLAFADMARNRRRQHVMPERREAAE